MMKEKRGKKKRKKGDRRWLRAIIGILLALIMLGSVIVAMLQI